MLPVTRSVRTGVPERFLAADRYRARREWDRYEGTPQRELLRRSRERFLQVNLRHAHRKFPRMLELGPGPGRFSPILARFTDRLLRIDVSRAMLKEARRHAPRGSPRADDRIADILGDAGQLPLPSRSVPCVVALGNLLGFAGDRGPDVLDEISRTLTPRGMLVLETMNPPAQVPRFVHRMSVTEWRRTVHEAVGYRLITLLREGWERAPQTLPRPTPSTFSFISPEEVVDWLDDLGFEIGDQMVTAPLLGGEPSLVAEISRGRTEILEEILRWEDYAGRRPEFLRWGGHTLTVARAP